MVELDEGNGRTGRTGAVPAARKAGPLLFLSSVLPVSPESGRVVRNTEDLPESVTLRGEAYVTSRWQGPIKAQTWMIYENLTSVLAEEGCSLADVVRQRIFVRDVKDTYAMEETMLSFFPEEKPCTWIAGMGGVGFNPDVLVQVDIVACRSSDGEVGKETITLPELARVTSPYPNAVKVGDLIFLGAFMGAKASDGRLVKSLDELGDEAEWLKLTHDGRGDSQTEAMRAQQWLIVDHMKRVLEHLGGDLSDLLRIFRWFGGLLKDRVVAIGHNIFGEPRSKTPASTGFTIANPSVIEDCKIIADGIALSPGTNQKKMIGSEEPTMEYCNVVTRGGPYCFISGSLAMDTAKHSVVRSLADLGPRGLLLKQHMIHGKERAVAQAWRTYANVDAALKEVGSGLDKVVHQNIFLSDASDYLAVERVAEIVFEEGPPPTTIIPVDGIGPDPDILMEIETISLA